MYSFIYCVYCIANTDASVSRDIEQTFHARAISLSFDREEHKAGKWIVKTHPLLWGYVFVYADSPLMAARICQIAHVNRILQYGDGESNLRGEDRRFAEWVVACNGHIGLSQALLVGDRTRIISGPLKEYEGVIKKMNRQKGCALVDIVVGDTVKPTWLYFEWMTKQDGQLVKLRKES